MQRGIGREKLKILGHMGHSYNKPLPDWSEPSKNRRIEVK